MNYPRSVLTLFALLALAPVGPTVAQAPSSLSLEDLLQTEIKTASKYTQTTREAPASVTVISAEEIASFGYRTLEEVLVNVRGFYVSNDRNYGYLGTRGFSRPTDYNSRILLLLNGHVLNENYYGSAGSATDLTINLEALERIEIVRGPGSALYGTGAMLAVVNLITKSGASTDGLQVGVESGSFGRQFGSLIYGKRLDNGVEVAFSAQWGDIDGEDLFFEEYNDPATNNGVAERLDWDKLYGGFLALRYRNFEAQASFGSREKGIPTGAFGIDFNDPGHRTLDERTTLDLRYDWSLAADKSLVVRGYYDEYYYDGTYVYEGYPSLDENDGRWWGVEPQFTWDLGADNRLIVGAEYQDHFRARYRVFDEETTYYVEDIPYQVSSLYLQDSYQVTRELALTLGVRADDYSDVGTSTNPRFALVYHPSKSATFKALYGEAFRRPNHYEVYYEFPDQAKGNSDLRPEEIRTTELIWEQQLSKILALTATVYNYDMTDLITGTVDPLDGLVQFRNVDSVEANGVELELGARLPRGWSGYLSYAYQETEDQSLRLQLSNSPQHLVRAGLRVPLTDDLNAGLQVRYESERTTVYDGELDDYLIADLHFTATLLRRLKLGLHVLNLFDEAYSTPGGFEHLQGGILQNGRDLRLRLGVLF